MSDASEIYLSAKQVAAETGYCEASVRNALRSGRLRAVQAGPGCLVRIPRSAIAEWLDHPYRVRTPKAAETAEAAS